MNGLGGALRNRIAGLGLVVFGWLGLGVGVGAATDPLTAAERAWLKENEPIVFVSQTQYPPFEFVDSGGERQGMSLDLVRWMARRLGFQAEFWDMSFQQAQEAVLDGRVDVLTSLFRSDERDLRFDFSVLTWAVPSLIFVRSERPDIARVQDLRGKKIAMQRGDYAEEFLRSRGIEHNIASTLSFAEAADQILAGEADAMVGDLPIVLYHLYSHGLVDQMKSVGEPLYIGRNSMAVREGRRELVGILNKGLKLARERGEIKTIESRWLGTPYGEVAPGEARQTLALSASLLAGLAIAIILLVWIAHLRRVLGQRTAELREAQDAHKPITKSRPWRMLLRRSCLLLGLLIPLGFVANHVLNRFVLMPGYLALEQKETQRKLNGAMDAIRHEAEHLGKTASDWAYWDDTYAFALDLNQAYVDSNLRWPSLSEQSEIDLMIFYDLQGHLLWQGAYDPFAKRPVALEDFKGEGLPEDHVLLRHPNPNQPRTGLWLTEIGPMLVATCAILPSDQNGPARGTLVLGRLLRENICADLASQLGGAVDLANLRSGTLTEKQRVGFSQLEPGTTRLEESSPEILTGTALMADLAGRPALLLTLEFTRDIVGQGRATAQWLAYLLFEFILIILAGTAIGFIYSFREAFRRQAHVEALVETRTQALRDSEKKWRSYVESAPMGIFIVDAAGRYLEVNPAACRLTGYTAAELTGKTFDDLLVPEYRAPGQVYFQQLVEQGHASGEFRFLHQTGGWRGWSVAAVRLDDQRLLGFAEDITARQQAEEARELLQIQLSQAQKMESIGRLAGGVAHDFNNMLGVILGYAELGLETSTPGTPIHDGLQEIHLAATRSAGLTRQLLAFARKQTILPKVLDLNETITSMLNMLRRLIGEQIELDWRPGPDASPVLIDPSQVDQLLVNLCVNARDAIGDVGKVTLETGRKVFDADACARYPGAMLGDYVCLSVSDSGCGMDDETRAHIFEPFFTTKREGSGTGLGLATVYGIVKQNQGFISVSSVPGQGTSFRLYFPQPGEAEDSARLSENGGAEACQRGPVTILLVEDEVAHLNVTQRLLERAGYLVLPAATPGEAIQLASEPDRLIDLLLTDVVMPEMNGRDLAQKLLTLRPNLPRLYMSGYTSDILAPHGVLDEGVGFLSKPFSVKELTDSVRAVLDGSGAGRA